MHDEQRKEWATFTEGEYRERLVSERAALISCAHMKLDAGDFHAVADAAMDCREIDAKLSAIHA